MGVRNEKNLKGNAVQTPRSEGKEGGRGGAPGLVREAGGGWGVAFGVSQDQNPLMLWCLLL